MSEERPDRREEQQRVREQPGVEREREPDTRRRPVPGVTQEPEPDAGNIVPAEDQPGTL
jgi:hypothetical protein